MFPTSNPKKSTSLLKVTVHFIERVRISVQVNSHRTQHSPETPVLSLLFPPLLFVTSHYMTLSKFPLQLQSAVNITEHKHLTVDVTSADHYLSGWQTGVEINPLLDPKSQSVPPVCNDSESEHNLMWLWVFIPPEVPALPPTPTLPQKNWVTCPNWCSNRCCCQEIMSGAQTTAVVRAGPEQTLKVSRETMELGSCGWRLGGCIKLSHVNLLGNKIHIKEHRRKKYDVRNLGFSNRFWQKRISCQSPVIPGLREHGSVHTQDLCLDSWHENTDLSILLSAYTRDDN